MCYRAPAYTIASSLSACLSASSTATRAPDAASDLGVRQASVAAKWHGPEEVVHVPTRRCIIYPAEGHQIRRMPGVGSAHRELRRGSMSEPETNRPMPAEQAIHWKPLRAAHYIMASLQSADGGRRTLVVRQEVLARAQRFAAAAHARRVQGSCSQSSPARLGILGPRQAHYLRQGDMRERVAGEMSPATPDGESGARVEGLAHDSSTHTGRWRAVARDRSDRRGEAGAIRALNAQRTAELPERVRRQFRLTP